MIRSEDLQQDKAKLKLCIERARSGDSRVLTIGDQVDIVPFEIDAEYVARARKDNPTVTFFSTPGSLYECKTGGELYGPVESTGESSWWHVIRPPSFNLR